MTLLEVLKETLGNPMGWEGRQNNKSAHPEVELYIALRAGAEMVPNPISVFDLIGPREVWSPRNFGPPSHFGPNFLSKSL